MSASPDLVTQMIKFGNQNNGRDKVFRLVQYASKMVWWNLHKNSKGLELVEKLKSLESSLSMTRKLLRFGKSLDFLQGALKSVHLKDTTLRLTITMSKLNQACFLMFDHIIYAHNIGLINADKKKWSNISAKFWVASLILNLTRNLYDIINILQEMNADIEQNRNTSKPRNGNLTKAVMDNKPVFLDLVKNLADLVLPLTTLGKLNASPGMQGFLGFVSSVAGIVTVWDPTLKLVP